MRTFRSSRALPAIFASAALAATLTIPALGQNRPESILPPGFGDPNPAPSAAPVRPRVRPTPAAVAPPRSPAPDRSTPADRAPVANAPAAAPSTAAPVALVPPVLPGDEPTPDATPTPSATPPSPTDFAAFVRADMPSYARRSLASVGVAGPSEGAMAPDAFGRADGRFLETLMRRLHPPVASRWLSIALRRTLMARVDTPRGVNGADFAAERAWLLVRMGESVAARAMTQAVDTEDYTPKMFEVAMQAALAMGDPAALCPAAEDGARLGRERAWVMAQAICAGLSGTPARAQPMLAAARKSGVAGGVDLLLAQKVIGGGGRGRQAVTIEWDNVPELTAWRYGLAMATGVEIPGTLIDASAPAVQGWRSLSPSLAPGARAASADFAAARGILSSAALVDLYAAIDAGDDQVPAAATVARDLRTAYEGADAAARAEALAKLWDEPKGYETRYARLVLTAGAATRIPTTLAKADTDRLIAAMLSAGFDTPALRWRDKVLRGSDGWAMLTLVDPSAPTVGYGEISGYAGANDSAGLKQRMYFAALAGLGRLTTADIEQGAKTLNVPVGQANSWTRAIGKAALDNEPGTVVLLAATGMQSRSWRGVPPEALYHICAALRAVGLVGEARMIAVEAMSRL
ncbi:hypothetical protein [Sphingomonas sp. TREG-RG-20F-R18-01]|uniref:hypothetical protein n=1 Tax=Sphingomonas sp. TREG-RG-20F-R18-01 TaxID=2914982 RepID=UPI001F595481|nr:hypothetical protein [Sphingomonas sp. TREG-RG-20F-R18-01]